MSNTTTALPSDAMHLIKGRDELVALLHKLKNHEKSQLHMRDTHEVMNRVPRHTSASHLDITQGTFLDSVANSLQQANIVLWREDLLSLACQEASVYTHTKLALTQVPSTVQWWPRIDAMGVSRIKAVDGVFKNVRLEGLLVIPLLGDDGGRPALCLAFVHKVDGYPLVVWSSQNVGQKIPLDSFGIQKVVASLDFMAQDFTEQTTCRAPARFGLNKQKYVPVVRTVQLRARPKSQAPTGDTTSREYEHSWMVTGHRRRLAQPRKADGAQVVWVRPYVKGDPAKPLLTPHETIIKVAR